MRRKSFKQISKQIGSMAMEAATVVTLITTLGFGFVHFGNKLKAKEAEIFNRIVTSIDINNTP